MPTLGDLIELDLEGHNRADGGSLYPPESASAIIKNGGAIGFVERAIADPIPPSSGLPPTGDDGVHMETAPLVEELDRFPLRGEDADLLRTGWLIFEHMFER